MGRESSINMVYLKRIWCWLFHTKSMIPIHGKWTCPQCGTSWTCHWEIKK